MISPVISRSTSDLGEQDRLSINAEHSNPLREYFPWLLSAAVLVVRAVTSGPVYFSDGPAHVAAILNRTYVIQAPGYWLWNRLGGLFPNPEHGLLWMNWAFATGAIIAFYVAAREFLPVVTARLATLVYSVIFYAWFSGNVHSTYASQLFFPPLIFWLLLRHRHTGKSMYLMAACIAFAVSAGFRPSDGAFLLPLLSYYVIRHASLKEKIASVAVVTILCLGWLIPTHIAYHQPGVTMPAGYRKVDSQMLRVAKPVAILTSGVNGRSMANVLRYFLPLGVAFWPLLLVPVIGKDVVHGARREASVLLWIWLIPASVFFIFFYISNAPYLDVITAAALLLLTIRIRSSERRIGHALLVLCFVSNVLFYEFFRPVSLPEIPAKYRYVAEQVVDVYVGKFSRYGVERKLDPRLSDSVHNVAGN